MYKISYHKGRTIFSSFTEEVNFYPFQDKYIMQEEYGFKMHGSDFRHPVIKEWIAQIVIIKSEFNT